MMSDSELSQEPPTLPVEEMEAENVMQIRAPNPTSICTGAIIAGRYRLTELIGEGGTSRVYKAEDQFCSMPGIGPAPPVIAVKLLSEVFSEPAGRFNALRAHVNRLRRLEHSNILRLFGCEQDGSNAFITMEYLSGEPAYAVLHAAGAGLPVPLEARRARRIIAMVANALKYVHAQGLVHGDLKPGNVMVGRDFGAKLIDFGMARWDRGPRATAARYASPQLMAGEEAHPTDDVYGLACVAYELLTGAHPFENTSAAPDVRPMPPLRTGLKPSEYAALLHALQAERTRRTSSVREFMAEFSRPPQRYYKYRHFLYAIAIAAAVAGIMLWRQDPRLRLSGDDRTAAGSIQAARTPRGP